ncbi:MAG: SDR family oxidoreductase [Bacteroidales bacterium]|nr:SDR family oxidoreductase [Bacteroidales bacterium]MCF8405050.1 SDR family oxidoreductase [Bacteroidales bacterium]
MKNKVVIITGASSGIGKALAEKFAREEAKVVLAARSYDKLVELKKSLTSASDVLLVKTDVSKEEDCMNLVDETLKNFGTIHILINNAGISMRALFEQTDLKVIKNLMDVNLWGTIFCTKYALPHVLKNQGSIVGVSSIAGYKGLPGRSGYSASKFAMHGFLEVLRIENMKKNLHVLIACPGFTASNIRNTALAADGSQQGESPRDEDKMMTAEEVADYIYNAIIKRKDRLTLTFQGKITVLLNKIFPRFMDKMVYNHMAKEPDSPFN